MTESLSNRADPGSPVNRTLLATAVLVLPLFAGCFGGADGSDLETPGAVDPADELRNAVYNTDGAYSFVLERGPYHPLLMEDVRFESFDGTEIASALWRPNVPAGVHVPVILMISPYFSNGLFTADSRTQDFFIHNYVSHGYAFAKVAIRGTSHSNGCMETMGPNEQRDIDEMVTFFGTQDWSNGNVGIIGLSYVGTTPWAAATFGNPHLKTIVPMSGVTSWFDLGFRNGTAEPRTPIHMPLYWANYGVGFEPLETLQEPDAQAYVDNVCPAPAEGAAASQYAIATGEKGPFADYWNVRDLRDRVVQNYDGAVFLVHGIRDWNVNIDMAYPFADRLVDKGLDVKMLLGQWQHQWPDQAGEDTRYDFAEILLRWFDTHLKETPRYHGANASVEDNLGLWRSEETWPPRDANWTALNLGDGVLAPDETSAGDAVLLNPTGAYDGPDCSAQGLPGDQPANAAWFSTGALDEQLRFAGLAQLHVTVTPTSAAGGEIQAELYHRSDDTLVSRVAHAVMDLRFHDGGDTADVLVPGQPVVAKMEFYPSDVAIPAGDELALRIVPDTNAEACAPSIQGGYIPGPSATPIVVHWGGDASVLNLPVIHRDVGDGRYPGQPEA